MKKLVLLILSFTLAVTLLPNINPSYYIWIDFSQLLRLNPTPVVYRNRRYLVGDIPCRTKLESRCKYNYTMIPPGWLQYDEGDLKIPKGSLLIPDKEQTRNVYSVDVELEDRTGQKLFGRLVLQLQQGIIKVHNRSAFYQMRGYPVTQEDISYYEIIKIPKQIKSNKQVYGMIVNRNFQQLNNYVQKVLIEDGMYKNCPSKIKCVDDLRGFLQSIHKEIQTEITQIERDQKKISENLIDLQMARSAALNQNLQLPKLHKIVQVQTQYLIKQITDSDYLQSQNFTSYNDYLSALKQNNYQGQSLVIPNITLDKLPRLASQLKFRLKKIDEWISNAVKNRQIMFDAITQLMIRNQPDKNKQQKQNQIKSTRDGLFKAEVSILIKKQSLRNKITKKQENIKTLLKVKQQWKETYKSIGFDLTPKKDALEKLSSTLSLQNAQIINIIKQLAAQRNGFVC